MKAFLKMIGSVVIKKSTQKNISSEADKQSVRPMQHAHREKPINKLTRILGLIGLTLFCSVVLLFAIRGQAGNPTPEQLNTNEWKDDGPLELSPERGRYALLYSIVENNSFVFQTPIAAFAAPDVAYHNGNYVSLFAPAVSVMAIPGYLLGKAAGLAQVGTFAMISLFAVANFLLIRAIAMRLGAHHLAAAIGGIAFLFASPAFAYAVTLYQHHISTFLILMSVYLLLHYRSLAALLAIWIMCGLSIVVDYPNFFMMLPIGIAALGKTFLVQKKDQLIKLSIPVLRVLAIAAVFIPLFFFFWFNNASYGHPLTLSGSVERAIEVKPNGTPVVESEVLKKQLEAAGEKNVKIEEKSIGAFFNPRNLMNSFYTHFLSLDRGLIFYTPVMLFGAAGLLFYNRRSYLSLFAAIIGFNVVLYSMWGDPYGGWAFGSRYLIPTYAILAVFIALLLTKLNKQIIFLILFFMIFTYSVGVNTLGAITSNRNPPQIETEELARKSGMEQSYTYGRNMQMLDNNVSKSFVYQSYLKERMSAWNYYYLLAAFIIGVGGLMLGYLAQPIFSKRKAKDAAIHETTVKAGKESYAI